MSPLITALAITVTPTNPRVEFYQDKSKAGDWRWRLFARNGENVGSGQGYDCKKDAVRGYDAHERTVLAVAASGSGKVKVSPMRRKARTVID